MVTFSKAKVVLKIRKSSILRLATAQVTRNFSFNRPGSDKKLDSKPRFQELILCASYKPVNI